MPQRTDNLVGVFEKRRNRFGEHYYSMIISLTQPTQNTGNVVDYELFLFCESQYWSGFTDESTKGDLMLGMIDIDVPLTKLGSWKKEQDGNLFIQASANNLRYAFYGIIDGDKILVYDAAPNNLLEQLFIQNNHI